MSKFSRNSLKYSVDEGFFSKWTSQMAYVLGFTFADGNIYKTSLSWDVQKRDLDILEKINGALNSSYPIKEQRGSSYRLRINNQILIKGAIAKGLLPKKSLRLVFPKIPKDLVRDFIRGYFEGDGWIVHRGRRNEVDIGFVCGNKDFLIDLERIIERFLKISSRIRAKNKITPRGVKSTTYLLEYYSSNAILIAEWLYKDLKRDDIYLARKHKKYIQAKKIYNLIWSKFKSKAVIQRKFGKPLKNILSDLSDQKLNGMQIARYLGTSKSSVYRWLETIGTKYSN